MIEAIVPGVATFRFTSLVLDLNGTLTLDGNLIDGVSERLEKLDTLLDIYIVTADTLGKAGELPLPPNTRLKIIQAGKENEQKLAFVRELGTETVAAVGNGANDTLMLKEAALGISVTGPEGTSAEAVQSCDILTPDITTALDLLLHPKRLIATLRK